MSFFHDSARSEFHSEGSARPIKPRLALLILHRPSQREGFYKIRKNLPAQSLSAEKVRRKRAMGELRRKNTAGSRGIIGTEARRQGPEASSQKKGLLPRGSQV
jgi:hypothetical protein